MSTHAATNTLAIATHSYNLGGLIPVAVVAVVIVTAAYLLLCWISPFTRCRHSRRPGRAYRCRQCHGTGTRLRRGRRLTNRLRNTHRHH